MKNVYLIFLYDVECHKIEFSHWNVSVEDHSFLYLLLAGLSFIVHLATLVTAWLNKADLYKGMSVKKDQFHLALCVSSKMQMHQQTFEF